MKSAAPSKQTILKAVVSYRDNKADWVVPKSCFGNKQYILSRIDGLQKKEASAMKSLLSYLFMPDGPLNLPAQTFRDAKLRLNKYEDRLARYWKHRTNGKGKKRYGKPALKAAKEAKYICQVCNEGDVRMLVIDHVNGRHDTNEFFLLCANCHQLKSRLFDWDGKKKVVPLIAPVEKVTA